MHSLHKDQLGAAKVFQQFLTGSDQLQCAMECYLQKLNIYMLECHAFTTANFGNLIFHYFKYFVNPNRFFASEAETALSDSNPEKHLSVDDSDSYQVSHCSSDQYSESDFKDRPVSFDNESEDQQTNTIPDT